MPYLVIDSIDDGGVQYRAGHIVSDETGARLSQQHGHVLTRVQEEPEHQLADQDGNLWDPTKGPKPDGSDTGRKPGANEKKGEPDIPLPPKVG